MTEQSTAQQEKFAAIANKLLNNTFLLKNQNRDEYAFIVQNLSEFEAHLSKIGYEVKNYPMYGIVQLKNKYEQGNRLKLKKVQSILLLLLRILFLDEKNKMSDSSDVKITVGRLQNKYAMLDIKNKKYLDVNTLKEALPIFKKYNLIDYDSGLSSLKNLEDFPILIYYTICLSFIGEDADVILNKTMETLASYNREDDRNEVNEDQADYHFDHVDLEVHGSVLLSGDNGCGKSTLLDAIQYVLTTEERFNKAANEKSSRRLDGYVRCKLGTEAQTYKRNGSRVIAYIALEFLNEANNSTVVIGVRMDAPTEGMIKSNWFIKKDITLAEIQFFTAKTPNFDLKDIHDEAINFEPTKTKAKEKILFYLGKLEDKFFELIHKALAFRPVDKVSDFINKFLLKENKIDVADLRKSINSIKQMEIAVKLTNEKIGALKNIVDSDLLYKQFISEKSIHEVLSKRIQAERIFENLNHYNNDVTKYQILMDSFLEKAENKRLKSKELAAKLAILANDSEMLAIGREEESLQKLKNNIAVLITECNDLTSQQELLKKLCVKLNINTKIDDTLNSTDVYQDKIAFITDLFLKVNQKIDDAKEKKLNSGFIRKSTLSFVETNDAKMKKLQSKQFTYAPSVNQLKAAILNEFKAR